MNTEKTRLSYTPINQLPALTWNWLKMNRATLTVDALPAGGTLTVTGADACGVRYSKDGAALFASLPAMKSGVGTEADAIMQAFAPTPCALVAEQAMAEADESASVVMRFTLEAGTAQVSQQAVIAEAGARLTLIMLYTEKNGAGAASCAGSGEACATATADAPFHAVQTKLWAKPGSSIHLVKVNLTGASTTALDDTAFYCEDGASVVVTQLELGGKNVYAGCAATLAGSKSAFKSDTAYSVRAQQLLDMNYAVYHQGKATETNMAVKGVVADDAVKVYRGTIDFQRGCAGATGNEQEETLLLSPTAVNKSIPVILCDEEDVSGAHGATIGRLSADELFYMQSRGISEVEAKRMMSRAKIASVAHLIPDESVVQEIEAYLDGMEGV